MTISEGRLRHLGKLLLKEWGSGTALVQALRQETSDEELLATLDLSPAEMQKALESLPSIGAGNVVVCNAVPAEFPWHWPRGLEPRDYEHLAQFDRKHGVENVQAFIASEEYQTADFGRRMKLAFERFGERAKPGEFVCIIGPSQAASEVSGRATASPPTGESLSAMADNVEAWMAKAALVEEDGIVATPAGYEALGRAAVKIKDSCGAMIDEMKRVIRAEQLAKLAPEIEAMAERGDLAAKSWLKWYHAHQASRAAITMNAVPTGFCKCGTKLQSQSSIDAGACVACRDRQRRIGT